MPYKDIEKRRAKAREYQRKRREKDLGAARRYGREYMRKWRISNPGENAAACHRYYVGHRDTVIAGNKRWDVANPERKARNHRAWDKKHPEIGRAKTARRRAALAAAAVGNQAAVKEIYARALDPKPIRCYYCHEWIPPGERHVDHVWPLSEGGPHTAYNLVIAHKSCNLKKGTKLPEEVGLLL
jgi:5-methylcytosine-specific restriction endonuclease McrA